jgi:hypothetical protein
MHFSVWVALLPHARSPAATHRGGTVDHCLCYLVANDILSVEFTIQSSARLEKVMSDKDLKDELAVLIHEVFMGRLVSVA